MEEQSEQNSLAPESSQSDQQEVPVIKNKGGRPKGVKNKPKRGRPKGSGKKRPVGRPPLIKKNGKMVELPTIKKYKEKKEKLVTSQTLEATPIPKSKASRISEEDLLNAVLDDEKFTEAGYNLHTDKIINQEPIDVSYYYRGSKNVPIAGAQYEFTRDMVEELKKCKEDIVYFAENFFYIVSIDNGKQKIKLYEAQRRILRSLVEERFLCLLSCRQAGKSTLLTIFALWVVCFNDDQSAAIVANKEATAITIFKRVRMAYEQLPNYIKPGVKDYGKTGMTLGNDSSIIVSTTTATSIRGTSLSMLAIDETAFIEPHILSEFWSSVIPTISSGKKSKILLVSTPNGVGNRFYEIYSGAESGQLKEWKSERIDWWDIPGRDEQWKRTQIELLGTEEKFLQEYGNAFLDDSSSAVGALLIEKFKQNKKPPIWTSEEGDYTVFEYPDKTKLYVIGVDVGEGIGRAASVAQVLDVTDLQNIQQVAVYGSPTIEPFHFANKLLTIGQSWGEAPMLIERNNCGAQVIDALHYHHHYEKIVSYSKISTLDKYNSTRNLGVLSHTNIRSDGIANMRYWVNHLQAVHINDPQTISEFETFVKQPNGTYRKRTDKFFDDRIMALTWALFILRTEVAEQYFQIVDFDLQNHPLKIVSNGYWENSAENYNLKDLSKHPSIVPKPASQENLAFPALGITQQELETLDKYELDAESLLEMGYQYFTTDV